MKYELAFGNRKSGLRSKGKGTFNMKNALVILSRITFLMSLVITNNIHYVLAKRTSGLNGDLISRSV